MQRRAGVYYCVEDASPSYEHDAKIRPEAATQPTNRRHLPLTGALGLPLPRTCPYNRNSMGAGMEAANTTATLCVSGARHSGRFSVTSPKSGGRWSDSPALLVVKRRKRRAPCERFTKCRCSDSSRYQERTLLTTKLS